MKRKCVAIDVRSSHHTGIGRHLRCVLRRLLPARTDLRFVAIANPDQDLAWLPVGPHVLVQRLPRRIPLYSPLEHVLLPPAIHRSGCDLVHFNNFNTPFHCPTPYVATIHDVIYLVFPRSCSSRLRAVFARLLLRWTARHAAHVTTVSDHSQRDIKRLLRVPSDHISVISNAPWEEGEAPEPSREALDSARLEAPYVLYVGNQTPHKNVAQLAAAVQIVQRRHPNVKLLAVGEKSHHFGALHRELQHRGLTGAVVFTGEVSDDCLAALYRTAAVVATASLHEGFGLPVLEGFTAGVPVVASDCSCLPEVAGDAALLADPRDPADFARCLSELLDDPQLRRTMIRRGTERARLFTWERVAKRLSAVYDRVLAAIASEPA